MTIDHYHQWIVGETMNFEYKILQLTSFHTIGLVSRRGHGLSALIIVDFYLQRDKTIEHHAYRTCCYVICYILYILAKIDYRYIVHYRSRINF